jgi:hypothetical protein
LTMRRRRMRKARPTALAVRWAGPVGLPPQSGPVCSGARGLRGARHLSGCPPCCFRRPRRCRPVDKQEGFAVRRRHVSSAHRAQARDHRLGTGSEMAATAVRCHTQWMPSEFRHSDRSGKLLDASAQTQVTYVFDDCHRRTVSLTAREAHVLRSQGADRTSLWSRLVAWVPWGASPSGISAWSSPACSPRRDAYSGHTRLYVDRSLDRPAPPRWKIPHRRTSRGCALGRCRSMGWVRRPAIA